MHDYFYSFIVSYLLVSLALPSPHCVLITRLALEQNHRKMCKLEFRESDVSPGKQKSNKGNLSNLCPRGRVI